MGNGLLRRILAIQSVLLGCGILLFLLFSGHAGGSGIETVKAIGVVLGLAINLALSLHIARLLKSPDAGSRTNTIAALLCLPSIIWLAAHLYLLRGA